MNNNCIDEVEPNLINSLTYQKSKSSHNHKKINVNVLMDRRLLITLMDMVSTAQLLILDDSHNTLTFKNCKGAFLFRI